MEAAVLPLYGGEGRDGHFTSGLSHWMGKGDFGLEEQLVRIMLSIYVLGH